MTTQHEPSQDPHADEGAQAQPSRPGAADPGTFASRRDDAVRAAVAAGLLDTEQPLAAFVDLAGLAETAAAVHAAWPARLEVRHAFAAKANSLVPVLRLLRGHGFGCEVASAGELAQALTAGYAPADLVFDSPAKSVAEISAALTAGIGLNIDSFQELERVDAFLARHPSASAIGVRLNPQVGLGGIAAMSTAGAHSKFGVALRDPGNRERLLHAYLHRPWLRWVHVHVGSQGCSPALIGAGVAAAVDFALEVNRLAREQRVAGIDIGGGLSVDFAGERSPDFAGHAATVLTAAPALARGEFRVVTEFGRAVMAKNGFMASRVEYTKDSGGRRIAVTHIGAHVATRTAFAPSSWPLRVLVYDAAGRPKPMEGAIEQDIAGPCCFAGDLVAAARRLPPAAQGDVVVVPDTGAYYFSTPFRYNSLPTPAVYGFERGASAVEFTTLRRAESVADVVALALGEPAFALPAAAA